MLLSRASSFLGPGSFFRGDSITPSLVLSLDAGNILSYPPSGFTISFDGNTHILNPNPSPEWTSWNSYGSNYVFGGDFIDSATPSAGWYLVDDVGNVRQVLSDIVWFNPNPTPVYNGTGWFLVLDGTYSITSTSSGIIFYETEPIVTLTYNSSGTWLDLTKLNNDATPQGIVNYSSDGGGSFELNGDFFFLNSPFLTFSPSSYNVTTGIDSVISNALSSWDNAAYSVESYSSKARVKFQLGENPTLGDTIICGFSEDPNASLPYSYNRVQFGFFTQQTGTVSIWESNSEVLVINGTFSTSNVFEINYDGHSVNYYIDDVLVYTSLNTPGNPVYFYSTFATNNRSLVNIKFGSYPLGIPKLQEPYTIETWIRPAIDSGGPQILFSKSDTYLNYDIFSFPDSNKLQSEWSATTLTSPTQSIIPNNWYHSSITWDGTDRKLYLNGELVASDTPVSTNTATDDLVSIGGYSSPGVGLTSGFIGNISIAKVHNIALPQSRLLSNFNSLKSRFGYTFGSMTFDYATSSYVISSSPDYAFGLNDFTVEAYFKLSSSPYFNYGGVVSLRGFGAFNDGVDINLQSINTSSPLIEFSAGGGFNTYTASLDIWYHAAISRTGGTSSFFVNGKIISQITDSVNYTNNDLVIGRYYTDSDNHYTNGIISNVRVVNGTGLYTSEFNVPSTPLIATGSNTKLLIVSQQTSPFYDISGLEQSVTASNTGWTTSVPEFYVTEGLVCYLDNYTGGSTWYDLSGNSNNASLYNGYSYNSTNGGVVRFDGVGTQNLPTSASRAEINLDLSTDPFTIMYGTRYLQNTPGYQPSGRSLGGRYNNWLLGTWNNKVNQFYNGSTFVIGGNIGDSTDTNWHIYTGTMESLNGTFSFWNNGTKLVNTLSSGEGPNGIVLGSDFLAESSNCDISFVLVYNRVLSDSEVELNFNNFRGRLGL